MNEEGKTINRLVNFHTFIGVGDESDHPKILEICQKNPTPIVLNAIAGRVGLPMEDIAYLWGQYNARIDDIVAGIIETSPNPGMEDPEFMEIFAIGYVNAITKINKDESM